MLSNILLVEDSEEDIEIIKINFKMQKICNPLFVVRDGAEAIDYINAQGQYLNRTVPDLILLDINLPKFNGKEVLSEIRKTNLGKLIPVVMLTTSSSEKDINESYMLGASGYISKPVDFDGLQKVVQAINDYWLGVVMLPNKKNS